MDYVFGFLLFRNFGSGVVEVAITLIIIPIHGTQEFLSCISLHIQIRCFHCLKFYSHRSGSRSPSKHLLGTEEGLTIFLVRQAFVSNSLGVASVGVSLNNNNHHQENNQHWHISLENTATLGLEESGLIYRHLRKASEDKYDQDRKCQCGWTIIVISWLLYFKAWENSIKVLVLLK